MGVDHYRTRSALHRRSLILKRAAAWLPRHRKSNTSSLPPAELGSLTPLYPRLHALAVQVASETRTDITARAILDAACELWRPRAVALYRFREADDTRPLELLAGEAASFSGIDLVRPMLNTAALQVQAHASQRVVLLPLAAQGAVRWVLCMAFDHAPHPNWLHDMELLGAQAVGHLLNAMMHEANQTRANQMHAILDAVRDGMILLDSRGRVLNANPAASRLLGIALETCGGELLSDVLHDAGNAGYSSDELHALATEVRAEPEWGTRRKFARQTERGTLPMELIGLPVQDADGHIRGRLLVVRDVSEQHQLDQYREEIAHMAVHDLRGPLASIVTGLTMVMEDIDDPTRRDSAVRTVMLSLDSAHQLMTMIESLLRIARLESRQMPLERGEVAAGALIEEAHQMLVKPWWK